MTDTAARNHTAAGQAPPGGALVLDHVAHFVADMTAAQATLASLGFALTPFSQQSTRLPDGVLAPAGSANRCAMLGEGYLEFLTPTAATPIATQMRAAMARHPGVHLLAFGTAAPDHDAARLAAEGFAPLPVVSLQREIETPDGPRTARFSVVRVEPGAMQEGRIQFVQHHTPELLWQARWLRHQNGALGLRQVIIVADDAAACARRYGRFTGIAPSGVTLTTARGSVLVLTPAEFRARFGVDGPPSPAIAGYVLATSDLAAARRGAVRAGAAIFERRSGMIAIVPPAIGGAIVFVQA